MGSCLPTTPSAADKFDEWFQMGESKEGEAEVVQQLHKVLRPFLLRRLKADVEKSLPPKKETILKIGMSEMQVRIRGRGVGAGAGVGWGGGWVGGVGWGGGGGCGSEARVGRPKRPGSAHVAPPALTPRTPSLHASPPWAQRKYYAALLQKDMDAVTGGADRSRLLNIVMQLRKCCNHPVSSGSGRGGREGGGRGDGG